MADSPRTGIKSFGAFIPRRRLQRSAIAAAHGWAFPALKGLAKGERSMCSWDEDAITMAVEAGRDALRGGSAGSIRSLTLASTTAPYADLNNAVLVGAALQLAPSTASSDATGSTRAGLSAVIAACRSGDGEQLVIASEKRQAKPGSVLEMQVGCGAGALGIGTGEGVFARFLGSETVSVPFFDHFRKSGSDFDYGWEERWIRDEGVGKIVPKAISTLLKRLGLGADRITHFGVAGGPSKSDIAVAKALKIAPEKILPDLQATVGDTGTAQSVLLLIAALERAQAGDVIMVASFAQGCEVVAFEMLAAAPATGRRGLAGSIASRIEETAYLKLLSNDGQIDLDWGMRAETDHKTALTQLYRVADQIFGFVGGQCTACSTVQFPRTPSCVNCGATHTQQPYALADEPAKVATYTADWLQFSPSPPLYMGLVQFDCGARLLMEMVDVGPSGIDVGTPLTMSFRMKERDKLRGWDRYFWKAAPAA
ncbi:MAG: zinc ribbon domain-containing protein [Pseudomonadota bacterium]